MINQENFLTREYIDNLYSTMKWSKHGADLYDYLDDTQHEDDFPLACQGEKMTFEEMVAHPDFRVYFEAWLPKRFLYAQKWLEQDIKDSIDKSDGLAVIKRTIFCNNTILERAKYEDFDIGRFWSTHNSSAYSGEDSEDNPVELTISAKICSDDIDWVETMRSRMDYTNGDVESEIYLREDATPIFIEISWEIDNNIGNVCCLTEERSKRLNLKALNKICFEDNLEL